MIWIEGCFLYFLSIQFWHRHRAFYRMLADPGGGGNTTRILGGMLAIRQDNNDVIDGLDKTQQKLS